MKVLTVPNVHTALPYAVYELKNLGVLNESRNGPVVMSNTPFTTVYWKPEQRVMFWPERDANPFFHFYEGLWMLGGRRDIAPLVALASNMKVYSDDGETQWDAYGFRWLHWFSGFNQLEIIINRLKKDPTDRRSVLQMWDAPSDLDRDGKAVPCNLMATFQFSPNDGRLNMAVFNRSNDIIWGCYGANAVHFSMLLEYMARRIGVEVGTYTQISVNWHAYVNKFEALLPIADHVVDIPGHGLAVKAVLDPYRDNKVVVVPMPTERLDEEIAGLLQFHDYLLADPQGEGAINGPLLTSRWTEMGVSLLLAHWHFRNKPAPARYNDALEELSNSEFDNVDWIVAAREWIERRKAKWATKTASAESV